MSKSTDLYLKYKTIFTKGGFVTTERLACYFGRAIAEVGESLVAKRESGYYKTIESARATFYTPFKNKSDDFVRSYLFNSKKMLNYVYANRMGNGSESSGDGYKNRGGGIFQTTGKNNLRKLSQDTGIDFLSNPDLLIKEAESIIASIWYWNENKLHYYADRMNIDAIGDIVNKGRLTKSIGDSHGFDIQKKATQKLLVEFKNLMNK